MLPRPTCQLYSESEDVNCTNARTNLSRNSMEIFIGIIVMNCRGFRRLLEKHIVLVYVISLINIYLRSRMLIEIREGQRKIIIINLKCSYSYSVPHHV